MDYQLIITGQGLAQTDFDEIYKGITRSESPDWRGWRVIDTLKIWPGFPHRLEYDQTLRMYLKDYNLQNK